MTVARTGVDRDRHVIVVDLGYGDAGKGTVVDWLCATRPVGAVVRFNGGAQAGHNVVTEDGRHHTFAQFGSGTLRGVRTHLSRYAVVDPLALVAEAEHLVSLGVPDPLGLVTVDARALLATPYHRAANRAREIARGRARHGSCGMGVGETMAYHLAHPGDAPRVADCATPEVLADKLALLRDRLAAEVQAESAEPGVSTVAAAAAGAAFAAGLPPVGDCVAAFRAFAGSVSIVDDSYLPDLLRREPVVFEGAQGVLLDEWYGFHPYTTWSTTTFQNAETLLAESGRAGATPTGVGVTRLGVVRVTSTRHGPGPLVTEDPTLTAALPDPHNPENPWQGPFRVGHFDAVAHRYAIEAAGGVDAVALTHLDAAARYPGLTLCREYQGTSRLPVEPGQPGGPGWLSRQQHLTGELLRARPVHGSPVHGSAAGWADAVADALGAPVAVTSHGPTAADKRAPLWSSAVGPAANTSQLPA